MKLYIVSGLSGSGKTIALQVLEDMGMYCIDNLPAALLPALVGQLLVNNKDSRSLNAAVGIDARNLTSLETIPEALDELKALGAERHIIFLESEENILLRRFRETRRKHPMIGETDSLTNSIRLERERLKHLSLAADIRIDTTHTTPHDLRQLVREFVNLSHQQGVVLVFESFGFKHGAPLDADYVFDVRCLPNPYWQSELRSLTGLDEAVINFMHEHEEVSQMKDDIAGFLERWLPGFIREQRSHITIALGCTGGQHRSVYMAEQLAKHFFESGTTTQTRHRELP
ncbi:MAG: RNase adapter RapZ [Gammaproteobacteria bacterium]|nr:RNase adapter RapZ [Gammaproteobacteria bacterium]